MKRYEKNVVKILLILMLLSGMLVLRPAAHSYAVGVSPVATAVYGQGGSFTANTANNGGVSATSLSQPYGNALDSSGNLYVADSANSRVLYYVAGSTTATRVYGQGGSFTANTANNGGISANSLNTQPASVAVDSSGNLYVADTHNNRVLYYAAGSTTATRVYGQGGSFITNNGGISTTSLNQPFGIALDSSGNLYVADYGNSRVLYYAAGSTTATRVYGQGGSFATNTVNNGGVSATSLNTPVGMALDSSGNLYVADFGNNRVLYYPSGTTTATRVYGQGGSFTANTANNGGVSATSLSNSINLCLDSSGNLYVADLGNSRVLYYPSGTTTATRVYGQKGSFTTNSGNNGGISATSLNAPAGVTIDSNGNLYVDEYSNNRVLKFQTSLSVTTQPPVSIAVNTSFTIAAQLIDVGSGGVWTDFTGAVSVAIKSGTGTAGATLGGTIPVSAVSGVATFSDLAIDTAGSGYILTMSYPGVGSVNTNAFVVVPALVGPAALSVYGQGGSFTTNAVNTGGVSATSLGAPRNSVLDSSGNLYVADFNNNRVLYYPAGSTTATRVYGQGGIFTTNTANKGGISANSLSQPTGVALDSSGNLYIADTSNNRVLYYPAGSTTATIVYGQAGSFTTNTTNNGGISAVSLYGPNAMTLDSSGNLYVTDYWNSRVLYYPAGTTTATIVYGQAGSFTTNTVNNGGISATSLNLPIGVALVSSGNLYIDDSGNNRVLSYPTGSTTATTVYGQGGSFTTNTANKGGISATSLNTPWGFALDSSGNLYVADTLNNRMLYYPVGSTTATRVYGQSNNFSTNTVNNSGINKKSLYQSFSVTADKNGNLYVTDTYNNRVLVFQTALSVTTQPPASTPASSPFTVASQLSDIGSGQIWTDFTGAVSISINAGTGTAGATLNGGATVVSAVSGLATFSNLTVRGGTGYILTMSSPGVGSATTNAFNSVAGTIIFTYLTSPTFTFTLTGSTGTITSQHTFKINDSTGSGFGWHVNITSTQFVSGTNTLPTTALTITGVTAACTAGQTCVVPVNGINTYPMTVPAATSAPASVAYMSANGGTGTGDVIVTTTFSLSIPPGTPSGTYTSTLTETVVNTSSYYNIVNRSTGQVADDSGNSLADGATIIQYPSGGTGSLNQQWQLIDVGGGYDRIMNLRSGKALDVSGSALVDGAGIVQNGYTGIASQQWQVVSVGGSYFKIVNRNSGKVLSSPIGGGSNPLIQVTYTAATTQQWQFVPLP